MKIHPVIVHQSGIVNVTMTASFIGDQTDATDQQHIQAYGDPLVNLGGLFSDPVTPSFEFVFPAAELYVGLTTDLQNHTARFMSVLTPVPPPSQFPAVYAGYSPYSPPPIVPTAGPLDCVVSDPVHAATVWASAIEIRALAAMVTLRAKTPGQLTSLPDSTV